LVGDERVECVGSGFVVGGGVEANGVEGLVAEQGRRRRFLAKFLAAWALLNVADLDFSTPNWLRAVMQLWSAFIARIAFHP
jgi:hypothetical protein